MIKSIIINLRLKLANFLKVIAEKLTKFQDQSQHIYNSLAPKILTDSQSTVYVEAIKEGVERKNIKNIAVSGSYGSGKSSIINTFSERYKRRFRILPISLASFQENGDIKKSEDLRKLVELSILQQIFYHVTPSKIPNSRFKRISNFQPFKLSLYSIAFTLWISSAVLVLQNNLILYINPKSWTYDIYDVDLETLGVLIVFFLGLFFLISRLIKFLHNSKVNKLNLKGEIELGKDANESILNKHLDEVLYFFEENSYDVVIIEDLDRFDNVEIFAKLREINTLLNSSEQIANEIVFLYAVRDDIFHGSERTKFFDFIIPVIPVINPSNSNEILKGFLQKIEEKEKPSEAFIDEISILIKDMRLLLNIWNEYLVYRNVLKSKLSQDKLLAIIIYKNLLPNDFIKLNNAEGILYEIFNAKDKYLNYLTKEFKSKISAINKKINEINNEELKNLQELKRVYLNSFHDLFEKPVSVIIDGVYYSFKELLEDDNFDKLRLSTQMSCTVINPNNPSHIRPSNIFKSFNDIEKLISEDYTYEERKKLIQEKSHKKLRNLQLEVKQFQSEVTRIKKLKIDKIINLLDIEVLKEKYRENLLENHSNYGENIDEKKEDLIISFIKNGYIDEHYYYFISYFYDITLSRDEYNFIQNVLRGKLTPFDQSLDNPKDVIKRIQERYFDTHSILNYSIVCLLLNEEQYKAKLDAVITVLSDNSDVSKQFIDQFVAHGRSTSSFIKRIGEKWKGFWRFIEESPDFSPKHKLKYLRLIIENVNIQSIVQLAEESNLKLFIEDQNNFNNWIVQYVSFDKIIEVLQRLNIRFTALTRPEGNDKNISSDLFHSIILNSNYDLNSENINIILQFLIPDITEEELSKSNLTSIFRTENEEFINNIEDHLNDYVDLWYKLDSSKEKESTIIYLLNHDNLEKVWQEDIIIHSEIIIRDLSKIKDPGCKELLLYHNQVQAGWKNILDYFKSYDAQNELDEELYKYLNKKETASRLAKDDYLKLEELEEDEDVVNLSLSILYDKRFDLDSYEILLNGLSIDWDLLDLKLLSFDHTTLLIEKKWITLSQRYFEQLQEFHDPLHLKLIELNWSQFYKHKKIYNLDEGEIYQLLQSEIITLEYKKDLILSIDQQLLTSDEKISAAVVKILSHVPCSLSFNLLSGLFDCDDLINQKLKLLEVNFENLTDIELKTLVIKLGGKYPDFFKKRKKPRIKNTPLNYNLIEELKERGLVHGSKDLGSEIKVHANY